MIKIILTVIAAGMKFVRKAAQCTLFDHKEYQDILNELQKLTIIKINGYILHLEPKLGMCGVIPFLPQTFSWCGHRNLYIACSMFENGQISTRTVL